jgi:hypothetical protein
VIEGVLDAARAVFEIEASLGEIVARFSYWAYALIFAIVFCETGLVVTPFLPGDSLLFAAGALSVSNTAKSVAHGGGLHPQCPRTAGRSSTCAAFGAGGHRRQPRFDGRCSASVHRVEDGPHGGRLLRS